jgi:hypothetical protein
LQFCDEQFATYEQSFNDELHTTNKHIVSADKTAFNIRNPSVQVRDFILAVVPQKAADFTEDNAISIA